MSEEQLQFWPPGHDQTIFVRRGYHDLFHVLVTALRQAQEGKGATRHANSRPFDEQPIMVVADMVGEGFLTGQAIKKIQESQRLDVAGAIEERLGAINYLAASILRLQKGAWR